MSTKLTVANLETLFTADVSRFEKGAEQVEDRRKRLGRGDVEVRVTAETRNALASMDRVEASARALPDAQFQVDADTSAARGALDDVVDDASDAGGRAGDGAGKGLAGGIVAAIATIPVAGAVVGIGAAIGKSLLDGLQVEVRSDRLMAQTGLDPATVGTLARAAGEAYAGNFGESIAGNMDTARLAVQSGLLDPASTARDAQAVIESLSGVADILGEDIPRVARSTAQLLRTGLARDAQQAFDIIVKGQQSGLNVSEDWLDTLDEYSTQWRKLGLEGDQVLALLSQGVRAGARDTDVAADALKEFSIRAIDGSKLTKQGFDAIGLSAEDMAARIARGGPDAAAALDETLDRLRAIEDPAARSAAAVALFGTQAEDMGAALFALDLSTAVDQLGQVEGAAKSALDAIGDNAASDIESAQRNITVATDGIKGALASAFNPEIEDFATFVSENREQVMQFLLDLANGGLDVGRSIVEGMADGAEGIGQFISGPMADLLDAIGDVVLGIDAATPGDQGGQAFRTWADEAVTGLRTVKDSTGDLADDLRTNLIANGIDPAQQRLNDFAIPLVAQAALHDASMRLAADLDDVGYAADGSRVQLELLDGAVNTGTESGRRLDEQLRGVVAGLDDQTRAGLTAGETQETLTARYDEGRAALVRQLEQMGLTTEQAEALAAQYGAIPGRVDTTIAAHTAEAQRSVDTFVSRNNGRTVEIKVYSNGNLTPYVQMSGRAAGSVDVKGMAAGGVLGAPLDPIAQMVPPGTLRVVGDRMDVDEAYVPLDGSARSWAILREALRRMPGGMADGGITGVGGTPSLTGLAIEGTLDLGDGLVGVMRGVVRSELSEQVRGIRAGVR